MVASRLWQLPIKHKRLLASLTTLYATPFPQHLHFHQTHLKMSHPVKLAPALPTDLYAIGALECLTFYDSPFSAVAFGPTRDSVENLTLGAQGRAKPPSGRGQTNRIVKAVVLDESGEEEIVGAAVWTLLVSRRDGGDEFLGGKQEDAEKDDRNPGGWGIGANVQFCAEIFGKGDESMLRSCEGNDYASKSYSFQIHSHPTSSLLLM